MTGPTLGPVMVSERIASVDIVRGFALWGVLLINMMNYGALNTHRWSGPIDRLAFWAQRFFFAQKSWRLFSFLFGFGFALLLIRASACGAIDEARFRRRASRQDGRAGSCPIHS